jgi:uncharacterized membrane protein HdeD (DUF308 family)
MRKRLFYALVLALVALLFYVAPKAGVTLVIVLIGGVMVACAVGRVVWVLSPPDKKKKNGGIAFYLGLFFGIIFTYWYFFTGW